VFIPIEAMIGDPADIADLHAWIVAFTHGSDPTGVLVCLELRISAGSE
jgi:hypothetical protein